MLGLNVRVDDTMQLLAFADKRSWQRFVDFVRIYQTDSGNGNGYGAYWIFPIEAAPVTAEAVRGLDWSRINTMAHSVAMARTGAPHCHVTLGANKRGICFDFGFPRRQAARPGEMYRRFRGKFSEQIPMEGRVLRRSPKGLIVVPPRAEDQDGRIDPEVPRAIVPAREVMWIPDWMKALREDRARREA